MYAIRLHCQWWSWANLISILFVWNKDSVVSQELCNYITYYTLHYSTFTVSDHNLPRKELGAGIYKILPIWWTSWSNCKNLMCNNNLKENNGLKNYCFSPWEYVLWSVIPIKIKSSIMIFKYAVLVFKYSIVKFKYAVLTFNYSIVIFQYAVLKLKYSIALLIPIKIESSIAISKYAVLTFKYFIMQFWKSKFNCAFQICSYDFQMFSFGYDYRWNS